LTVRETAHRELRSWAKFCGRSMLKGVTFQIK